MCACNFSGLVFSDRLTNLRRLFVATHFLLPNVAASIVYHNSPGIMGIWETVF